MENTQILLNRMHSARIIAPTGSKWRHKKGGTYQVIGEALHTDDAQAVILYQRIAGPEYNEAADRFIVFARPVSEWTPDRFTPYKGKEALTLPSDKV